MHVSSDTISGESKAATRWRRLAIADETANLLTHGAGLLLSLVGTWLLLGYAYQYGNTPWQIVGCTVYGVSLVLLYAASTLSHSFEHLGLRSFFRMLDQVCIFLLIAGTYTPFLLVYLPEWWRWAILVPLWTLTVGGVLFKLVFSRRKNVSTWFYVLLGWLPIAAFKPLVENVPVAVAAWIIAGGVLYTMGTFFLERDNRVRYFHAVWHLFVIAASICHYIAVLLFVIPWPAK
jgi:hemolysin III